MTMHNDARAAPEGPWRMLEGLAEEGRATRELLLRVEGRLEHVSSCLEAMTSAGLPRCAERGERLAQFERRLSALADAAGTRPACVEHRDRLGFVEDKLDTLGQRVWWVATSVGAAVIMLGLKSLWEVMTT